jgi:signal transduction histidine kinase
VRLPIRIRLTAWYVALLALVLVALGGFALARLESDLTGSVDRALARGAGPIARADDDFREVSAAVLPGPDAGAQLLDPDGRVRASYGAVAARPLPAGAGRTVRLRGEEYRLHSLPLPGGRRLVLAASLDGVQDAGDRLLVALLIGGPVALAVIAAGGWWLAGKSLRPVARMTAHAERIEIDHLRERLPVTGARDELAGLATTLNDMLDRLASGVEARRRLIGDASHELRTPLAAMRAEIDVALDDPETPDPAREVLESAREEVDRLTAIVRDLLTLARLDEGRAELTGEPVDLRELADVAARGLAGLDRRVRLVVTGPATFVAGDADALRRALTNLIDNAVKASPEGAQVTVAVWRAGEAAGLTVSDEGPGVPAAERERIFERFGRVDGARSRSGSGLGLAIARGLVEAQGGCLTLAGRSAFTITLSAQDPGVPDRVTPGLRPDAHAVRSAADPDAV